MKKIALVLLLVSYTFSLAQEKHRYVIVPKKFSFFKEDDKYNTSTMSKIFFENEGFEVFYDSDQMPNDLAMNRCSVLFVDAVENNTIFATKIIIEIKDCYNKVVYTSVEGNSREKELNRAYNLAFREALSSLKGKLNFKLVKEPAIELSKSNSELKNTSEILLTAVPTVNGYSLLNSNQENIFTLQKTSLENVYSAKKGTITGTFFKKNTDWVFEYYDNEELVQEVVNVEF